MAIVLKLFLVPSSQGIVSAYHIGVTIRLGIFDGCRECSDF